jgi:hypothetical protein
MLGNPGEMGRAKTDANAEKVRGIERPCYIAPMIFAVCKNARPEQSLAQDIMLYRVAFPHISSHEQEEKRGKKAFNKKNKNIKKVWGSLTCKKLYGFGSGHHSVPVAKNDKTCSLCCDLSA